MARDVLIESIMETSTTQYLIAVTHTSGRIELVYVSGELDASDPDDRSDWAAVRTAQCTYPGTQVALRLDNRGRAVTR